MMISPEMYYEKYLKGKTVEEIQTKIHSLKRTICHLKKVLESPPNFDMVITCPSEDVQLACNRMYLERAKLALVEAGGTYISTKAELKEQKFDANLPFINKVEFCIGGCFRGYTTITCTIDGDLLVMDTKKPFSAAIYDNNTPNIAETSKESFLKSLDNLHIGEWRRSYYNRDILDGTQWHLYIYYSNGSKPVKIEGSNDYPYNFDKLKILFATNSEE